MSDSCKNDLLIDNDEHTKSTRSNQKQYLKNYKLLNITRTVDVRKSKGTFIFHKGTTSSRIPFFVNDYHAKYISATTLKRMKSICKKTDTLVTRISSKFLLNRNIRDKRKKFGKIKNKNLRPLKATESCIKTNKTEKRSTTTQLLTIQDASDVSEDTDPDSIDISDDTDSESVICLGMTEVASSTITTNKNNNNNLNESDIMIVKQYCNKCGEDLNMEYDQIGDKHKCLNSARNNKKRTELTNSICSELNKNTKKVSKQDNITNIIADKPPSTTMQNNNCNNDSQVHNNIKTSSIPVETHDTACNTSNTSLFFNDKNVIINALKRKFLEFLDKKNVQASELISASDGNKAVNEEDIRQFNNQLVFKNSSGTNNGFEPDHNMNVNSEITKSLYTDDKFEQNCIDNTRDNYIFGYNYHGPKVRKKSGLRMIVIDGSNVALGHSKGKFFSSEGLKICIDYFYQRGHEVKAFVPQFRLKNGQTSNKELLQWLYNRGWVIFTPSREVNGRMIVPYDDRFIVQCAALHDAVIVSNDCYRDLIRENSEWKKTIENNLLMVTWVDDVIYFPTDPLGKWGPTLESFLRYS